MTAGKTIGNRNTFFAKPEKDAAYGLICPGKNQLYGTGVFCLFRLYFTAARYCEKCFFTGLRLFRVFKRRKLNVL